MEERERNGRREGENEGGRGKRERDGRREGEREGGSGGGKEVQI